MVDVTPFSEIRKQAEPEVITIPGFKPGQKINVRVRPIDVTPHLLEAGIGNPLLSDADTGSAKIDPKRMQAVLDAIARDVLVQPTHEEITAIAPLTMQQKLALMYHALRGLEEVVPFPVRTAYAE